MNSSFSEKSKLVARIK